MGAACDYAPMMNKQISSVEEKKSRDGARRRSRPEKRKRMGK